MSKCEKCGRGLSTIKTVVKLPAMCIRCATGYRKTNKTDNDMIEDGTDWPQEGTGQLDDEPCGSVP